MDLTELTGAQRRQSIDTQQVYGPWRDADRLKRSRFAGSMRWVRRSGHEYLLRKTGDRERSLGRRTPETEAVYAAFLEGRAANADRLRGLAERLDELAPVNRAMGLGRLPTIAARIARACDRAGLWGRTLFVVGTNALYAYEALAGVRLDSALVATEDIDLLLDARRRMALGVASDELRQGGLIGLLRRVDPSFEPIGPRTYSAANRDGYLVDLIRPEKRDVFRDRLAAGVGELPDDMEGAPIFGLDWLVNVPKVEAIVIDTRGYPAPMVAIDPRAFALHKAWLADRRDREPVKAARDREQARAAAAIAVRYLGKAFDSPDLKALPARLRAMPPPVPADVSAPRRDRETPDW